jgi:hypothetical protein
VPVIDEAFDDASIFRERPHSAGSIRVPQTALPLGKVGLL